MLTRRRLVKSICRTNLLIDRMSELLEVKSISRVSIDSKDMEWLYKEYFDLYFYGLFLLTLITELVAKDPRSEKAFQALSISKRWNELAKEFVSADRH